MIKDNLKKVGYEFEIYQPYNKNSKTNIETNCADLSFINATNGAVSVNNFVLNAGDSLSLGLNEGEINVSKFQLVNISASSGNVSVIRKIYL
jgi:hypothetical protein